MSALLERVADPSRTQMQTLLGGQLLELCYCKGGQTDRREGIYTIPRTAAVAADRTGASKKILLRGAPTSKLLLSSWPEQVNHTR
jgi:hypothetical protein